MNETEVEKIIHDNIIEIAKQQSISIASLEEKQLLVDDLGLQSMDIATLLAALEDALQIDPFVEGTLSIGDIRTVGDLYKAYKQSLNR